MLVGAAKSKQRNGLVWESTAGKPTTDRAPTIAKTENLSQEQSKSRTVVVIWDWKTIAAQKRQLRIFQWVRENLRD